VRAGPCTIFRVLTTAALWYMGSGSLPLTLSTPSAVCCIVHLTPLCTPALSLCSQVACALVCVMLGSSLLVLLTWHLYLISVNKTTIEVRPLDAPLQPPATLHCAFPTGETAAGLVYQQHLIPF